MESSDDTDTSSDAASNNSADLELSLPIYEALYDYAAEDSLDLAFKSGELLMILNRRDDGWWEAENELGQRGWVPSTYLKKVSEQSDASLESSSGDDEGEGIKPESAALESGKSSAVQVDSQLNEVGTSKKPLVSHFSEASLAQFLKNEPNLSTSSFVTPKISSSGVSVKGLNWNPDTNAIKPTVVPNQRILTLKACRGISVLNGGVQISSCHIRLCLHDGNRVLSNIYTVRSKRSTTKPPKYWPFKEKLGPDDDLVEDAKLFIRSDSCHSSIGILFQLCYIYQEESNNTEMKEVSCGWAFISLLNAAGLPISNGIKILHIQEGNPCKCSMEMDSMAFMQRAKKSGWSNKNKRQRPRLTVRMSMPSQKLSQQLNLLPETLIGPVSIVPVILMYRTHLANEMNNNNQPHLPTGISYSPVLATFPRLLDEPDILNAFRLAWKKLAKSIKKEAKKDPDISERLYKQLYIETAFILLQLRSLPCYEFGRKSVEEIRRQEINRLMELQRSKGSLGIVLCDEEHKPFLTNEIYFDILECL